MSKVVILSTEYHGDPAPGGLGTYVYYLARGLSAWGQQVHVVTISNHEGCVALGESCWIHRVKQTSMLSNQAAARLPYTNYALSRSYALWKYLVDEIPETPFDCLDVQDHLALGLWNALSGWLPMAVRVQTPIFLLQLKDVSNIPSGFDTHLVEIAESLAIRKAHVLIGSNEPVLEEVVRHSGATGVRKIVQRNPIDLSEFRARDDYRRKTSAFEFVFVGRLELRKGVHTLLEALGIAVRSDPGIRVKFVGVDTECGFAPGSVQQQLHNRARELNLEQHVEFSPPVPLLELSKVYGDSDAAVTPSLFDNAPYGLVAAMAAGLPVIGTGSGGMPDYIGDNSRGIIVPAGDADALAEALCRIAGDGNLRERLGQAARTFVETECNHKLIARQASELYGEMSVHKEPRASRLADVTASLRQLERLITDLDDWTAPELIARAHSYDAGYASGLRDGFAHAVRQNMLTRAAHRLSHLVSNGRSEDT